MSLSAAVIDALVAQGVTAEQLAAAVKADLAESEARLLEKRAKDAERQRRHRASRGVTVTGRDVTDQKEIPPDPHKKNNPLSDSPIGESIPQPKRASRLPDGFMVPDDWLAWAQAKRRWNDGDVRDEAACFCRYWQAKSGKDATKLDWEKTWRNWVTNSKRPNGSAPTKSGPLTAEDHDQRAKFFRGIGRDDQAEEHELKAKQLRQHDPPANTNVAALVRQATRSLTA